MNEIKGYVWLKSNAKCSHAVGDVKNWQGRILRALEINESTKSVLLVNNEATALGMFDFEDLNLKFHCEIHAGVIIPPNLNFAEKMIYSSNRLGRKGGYNEDVKKIVIAASLERQKVYDDFLMN